MTFYKGSMTTSLNEELKLHKEIFDHLNIIKPSEQENNNFLLCTL